jgi:hypothetical protein
MSLSPEGSRVLRALNQARVTPFRRLIDALPARLRAVVVAQLTELGRRADEQHDTW